MSLADQLSGPHGDLPDLRRLMGGGAPAQGRSEAMRQLQRRWQSADALRSDLRRRRAEGYPAFVALGSPVLFEALGRQQPEDLPRVVPMVPNLQGFMREAVEHGMVGAGLRRAWRVGPMALTGLGLRGVTRLPALARREFAAMLRSFIELELADFNRYHPPLVLLQPQITDLALAMHNPKLLTAFSDAVRATVGNCALGLATCNLPALGAMLSSGSNGAIEAKAIVCPWHPDPARLRPTAEAWHNAAHALGLPIWADRQLEPAAPSSDDRHVAAKAAVTGFMRDDLAYWLRS